jgi:hypothetical protein
MFEVMGRYNDLAYMVQVDVRDEDQPVAGSVTVEELLHDRQGETVAVTPTGPFLRLDLTDEASVLGALMAWTQVSGTAGAAPEVLPPEVSGAVY